MALNAVKMSRRIAVTVEELANVATHGFGLLASVAVLPVLVVLAARRGDAGAIVGACVFGVTLVGAYAASTLYHSFAPGPRKDLWRRLDQSAVYLLIAGTYTPFTLGTLRGPWGWSLFGTIWFVALLGILLKLVLRAEAPAWENATYLAMGWLVVLAIHPLVERIGWAGLGWLLAGGIAYSVGVVFLVRQSCIRFGHCAWHVCVLGGSACHAIAVIGYGLVPPP